MPETNLETLITRLLSDPACAISPVATPIVVSECVPGDVREFYSRYAGGRLFYDHGHKTPQFGCELGFPPEQPVTRRLPCDGPEFEALYVIASFNTGEEDCVVVSANPATFGHIYRLNYSLGDPELTITQAFFLARSFTRWLAMHVEAWDVYLEDWREGLEYFGNLVQQERGEIH